MVLSIVIVSWNVSDLLNACLASIYEHKGELDIEVIVVDSASADDSVYMVESTFPQVKLLAQKENVGFPRGNNIGMAEATGRYLMLLNPDTVVVGDALQQLVRFLDEHPDVGVVGPQLRFGDGTIQSSRRRFPSVWTGFFESTWLQPYAPKPLLEHFYVEDKADYELCEVDWVMGAALVTRREIVDQIGGMDPEYFMYSEELDWCRRIKAAGWRVFYLPAAQIIHYQGKSSEQASTARHINFNRAKLRYFRRYHGSAAAAFLRLTLLLNFAVQLLLEGFKGILGHRRDLRWQRVAAYWEVLKSGLPPR